MILWLTVAVAAADDGWFQRIRYGVGITASVGVGADGAPLGRHVVVEPLAFELRSFLTDQFAFHTTLNLGRMILPAVLREDGRIDYDLHIGAHLPTDAGPIVVIAPGASLAYSFTRSRYQRFVGDVRLGVDHVEGRWTTGVYVRPFAGWARAVGALGGHPTYGALIEVAASWRAPTRRD